MKNGPIEILRKGCVILDPVLRRYGFTYIAGPSGQSSGGPFARGEYVNGYRKLEVHFRYSLGLVTYHFREKSVDHESYMHALLGTNGGSRYPCFSDDALDQFKGLAHDMESFATAFLGENFEEFTRCVTAAEERKKNSGFARLP